MFYSLAGAKKNGIARYKLRILKKRKRKQIERLKSVRYNLKIMKKSQNYVNSQLQGKFVTFLKLYDKSQLPFFIIILWQDVNSEF